MIDFQAEALSLAESLLSHRSCTVRLNRLTAAFDASFLHYSRMTPDHWRHPRGTWGTFPDLPSRGSCVCLVFLAAKQTGCGSDRMDELVRKYHQYLGAMASRLSAEESAFARLGAEAAARIFPEETHFGLLAKYFPAYEPEDSFYLRAKRIAGRL